MLPLLVVFLLVSYLLGSIPFGLIVARRHNVDLRKVGSGNIGAANAFRALGPAGGAAVLALDGLKGVVAVTLAHFALLPGFLVPFAQVACGLAAILGHNYPVFLGFKGGKGIATSFGVLLALSPQVALMAGLLWLGMVALTRYSSVGSLAASLATPFLMVLYRQHPAYVLFGILAALLAFYRHRSNIQRLLAGQELTFDDPEGGRRRGTED
ncbi:MAG TPA: glycerol-3-phosphate 1-O-acyltransferase PlsY [Candidatus Nitrosotenuis sp.]|jgi:glycerol-3-phosphate acyltransferase PlsY|nr:glycerol-3-phosphate 1-O-acyltransferase PlsY [Candidatus Nitrosotenuis sp.]